MPIDDVPYGRMNLSRLTSNPNIVVFQYLDENVDLAVNLPSPPPVFNTMTNFSQF